MLSSKYLSTEQTFLMFELKKVFLDKHFLKLKAVYNIVFKLISCRQSFCQMIDMFVCVCVTVENGTFTVMTKMAAAFVPHISSTVELKWQIIFIRIPDDYLARFMLIWGFYVYVYLLQKHHCLNAFLLFFLSWFIVMGGFCLM